MPETSKVLTNSELPPAMKAFFEERYRLDCRITALKVQHIDQVADDRKALIRDFKAMSNIDTKVTDPLYKLYKLDREKEDFDSQADIARRAADLKRAFNALAKGQTLDFITVMVSTEDAAPAVKAESPFGGEEGEIGDEDDTEISTASSTPRKESAPTPVDKKVVRLQGSKAKKDPEPDPAWGATDQAEGDADHASDAEGHAYQEGLRFGQGGNADIKGLIKGKGLAAHSADAISMTAGHSKGYAEWQEAQGGIAAAQSTVGGSDFISLGH